MNGSGPSPLVCLTSGKVCFFSARENLSSSIRPKIASQRQTFDDLVEFEVDRIIDSKIVRGLNGRRIQKYRVRWKGYDPKFDTWETRRNLKNAPEALKDYEKLTHTFIQ